MGPDDAPSLAVLLQQAHLVQLAHDPASLAVQRALDLGQRHASRCAHREPLAIDHEAYAAPAHTLQRVAHQHAAKHDLALRCRMPENRCIRSIFRSFLRLICLRNKDFLP